MMINVSGIISLIHASDAEYHVLLMHFSRSQISAKIIMLNDELWIIGKEKNR